MSGCVALTSIDLENNKLTATGLEPFCSNPPPNLTRLEMNSCGLQGTHRTTSTTFADCCFLFVFGADGEQQRVRAALPNCGAVYF